MFGIGQFFAKIQSSFTKEVFVRTVIQESIKKNVGIEIPIGSITFKSSVVTLNNVSQSVRSAVFIKKQTILNEVMSAQSIRPVTDIR